MSAGGGWPRPWVRTSSTSSRRGGRGGSGSKRGYRAGRHAARHCGHLARQGRQPAPSRQGRRGRPNRDDPFAHRTRSPAGEPDRRQRRCAARVLLPRDVRHGRHRRERRAVADSRPGWAVGACGSPRRLRRDRHGALHCQAVHALRRHSPIGSVALDDDGVRHGGRAASAESRGCHCTRCPSDRCVRPVDDAGVPASRFRRRRATNGPASDRRPRRDRGGGSWRARGAGLNQAVLVAPLGAAYGISATSALAFALGLQATLAVVAVAGGLVVMLAHRRGSALRAAFP